MVYELREGFDYYKHLEDRSHADHIAVRVDKSIRESLASDASIHGLQANLSSIDEGVNRLNDEVSSGFELISWQLENINENLVGIGTIMEDGFDRLDNRLSEISSTLDELLAVAKTPEQTWANEQYYHAQTAISRDLPSEALSYVRLALSGDRNHTGYKLDSRFFELEGMILEGIFPNSKRGIIDLPASIEAHCNAARVAANSAEKSRHFTDAARICSFTSDDEKSLDLYIEAAKFDPNSGDAWYGKAKLLFRLDRPEDAIKPLDRAAQIDLLYLLRAGSDNDVLKYKSYLEGLISKITNELTSQMAANVSAGDGIVNRLSAEISSYPEKNAKILDVANRLASSAKTFRELPLLDLRSRSISYSLGLKELEEILNLEIASQEKKAVSERESAKSKLMEKLSGTPAVGALVGAIAGALYALLLWEGGLVFELFNMIGHLFSGAVFNIIAIALFIPIVIFWTVVWGVGVGAVGAFLGLLVGGLMGLSEKERSDKGVVGRQDRANRLREIHDQLTKRAKSLKNSEYI